MTKLTKAGKPVGRPTKLTPEVQDRIILSLRAGNYLETACKANGITKATLYNWLDRASRHKEPLFLAFLDAVEKAQSEAEQRDVALIAQAAQTQWQAAAWRLERKFPDRWGRREHMTVATENQELPVLVVRKRGPVIDATSG